MHKKINDQLLSQGINRGFLSAAALKGPPPSDTGPNSGIVATGTLTGSNCLTGRLIRVFMFEFMLYLLLAALLMQ